MFVDLLFVFGLCVCFDFGRFWSMGQRSSVMVIFRFFGQNSLKLELSTLVVHEILIDH